MVTLKGNLDTTMEEQQESRRITTTSTIRSDKEKGLLKAAAPYPPAPVAMETKLSELLEVLFVRARFQNQRSVDSSVIRFYYWNAIDYPKLISFKPHCRVVLHEAKIYPVTK